MATNILDADQVIKKVYDEPTESLNVNATVVATIGDLEVSLHQSEDSVTAHQGGTWDITDITGTISLPTGAATEAKQDTGNTSLTSIDTKLSITNSTLTDIENNTDGLETLITSSNTKLDTLITQTDSIESLISSSNIILTDINNNTDTLETLITSTNSTLADIENGIPEALGQNTMANSMPVVLSSDQLAIISSGNSTSTTLGSGAIFTGTAQTTLSFGNFTVAIISDVIGTFTIQWSHDAVTWYEDGDVYSIPINTLKKFSYGPVMDYFRVKYTNGGTAQGSFVLRTIMKFGHVKPSTHKLSESFDSGTDAEVVQAPIMARLPNDTYANIAGIKLDLTSLLGIADSTAIMANQGLAFKVSTNRLSTGATTETPFLLIDNPSGSGKIVRIDKIIFVPPENVGAATFRMYFGPTITANGTLLSEVGNRQTNQATGVGNFYTLPTASANGAFNFHVTLDQSGPPFTYDAESGTLIEPGFKMLITSDQTVGASGGGINLEYNEASI